MNNQNQNQNHEANTSKKLRQLGNRAVAFTGVALVTIAPAFAEEASNQVIDLTTAVTGVVIIAGLMSAAALKAVPTYAGWGLKKALAMLR